MATKIAGAKAALPAFKEGKGAGVRKFDINSNENKGETVSIVNGVVVFQYYESLLQDSVRSTVSFTDTGDSVNGKSVMEGLPIYGTEKVSLKIEDNNDGVLESVLHINKPTQLLDDTRKSLVQLSLASKEFFDNEKVRVITRMDGKISESIRKILTKDDKGGQQYLNTEKKVDIEDTSNNRNFQGGNKKPFYTINWLARGAVPSSNASAPKNSAGFLFWETADGFNFKSIDWLMSTDTNPVKKKYIFNETSDMGGCDIPDGYDGKALDYSVENKVDVQNKLKLGAYSTKLITFNPFDQYYSTSFPNAKVNQAIASSNEEGSQDKLKLGGKKLPVLSEEFNKEEGKEFSRTTFYVLDTGSLPEGTGTGEEQQQLKKSKEENNKVGEVLNQGIMRLNQLFAMQTTLTIPGDFTLRAGDAIYVDAPARVKDSKSDAVDKQTGGNYVIANLCHYIDAKNTLTRLDLIRDSFGRKPMQRG